MPHLFEPLTLRSITLPKRQAARGYVEPELHATRIPTPF